MRTAESSAKTRREAIQGALDKLGVELDEVEIEILDGGSKGFLGLGARDVRVKLTSLHEEEPEKPKRSERGGRDRGGRDRGGREGGQRRQRRDNNRGRKSEDTNKGKSEAKSEGQNKNRRNRNDRNDKGGDQAKKGPRKPRRDKETASKPRPKRERSERPKREPRAEAAPPITDEAAEVIGKSAAALLHEVITKMGIESTVSSSLRGNEIVLSVESEDSAILIGRKGRNLSSMQFLINRIALDAEDPGGSRRLVVDVEGYLDRRKSSLEEMALGLAERAKETGKTMHLKPLNPQERRIVHLCLEDDAQVTTYSLGSTVHRRVVIVPEGAEVPDLTVDDDAESSDEGGRGNGRSGRRDGRRDNRGGNRGGRSRGERSSRSRDSRDDARDDNARSREEPPASDSEATDASNESSNESSDAPEHSEPIASEPVVSDAPERSEPIASEPVASERSEGNVPESTEPTPTTAREPRPPQKVKTSSPTKSTGKPYKIDVSAIRRQNESSENNDA